MNKLPTSFKGLYPIVLCDGYCGIGKAKSENLSIPYFYIASFDKKEEHYFQPAHYFKLEDNLDLSVRASLLHTENYPSISAFIAAIDTFKNDTSLLKIVLARKRTHTLKTALSSMEILSILLKNFPTPNIFAYFEEEDKAFFGASPENLYSRNGNSITVDCIAGTTDSHKNGDLFTEKNLKEHQFVTKGVKDALREIAKNISVSEIGIKKAAALKHIYQTVSATLQSEITDLEIIRALHPTAATLGSPKEEALKFLSKKEPFDRGFYAGPIGWIHQEKAIIRVALRCALTKKEQLTLFAGAGIIKESSAKDEIAEIDKKFNTLEGAFLETTMSK
jgi:isochorismate synthase